MHLTRTGFNFVVAVYLAPLILMDFIGNTMSTGSESDYYYIKCIFDALLFCYAVYQMFKPATTSITNAQLRKADRDDSDVMDFEQLGAVEYMYCAVLSVYAAANWYFLHMINKSATGIISILSLVWSILSVAVCVLAAIQFYHLKSGKIVELKKRIIQ